MTSAGRCIGADELLESWHHRGKGGGGGGIIPRGHRSSAHDRHAGCIRGEVVRGHDHAAGRTEAIRHAGFRTPPKHQQISEVGWTLWLRAAGSCQGGIWQRECDDVYRVLASSKDLQRVY